MLSIKLKFVRWFHSKFPAKYCWADCVAWAYSRNRFNPFRIDKATACDLESREGDNGMCYCGGWNKGQCFDKLSKEEREAYRNKITETDTTKPPF